jgi:glycosyltransferase involved in cell wall biosynthesis
MVLFASTYEGFGLPIIEAQATGRPVVTSRVTAMPEVAGDGACLVDPYDVASIRSGVLRVLGDRGYRDSLVHRGFENVRRFEPGRIAAQYARLYEEVALHAASRGQPD